VGGLLGLLGGHHDVVVDAEQVVTVWVIVSTVVLLTVPGIRTLRRRDAPEIIIRSTSTAR
jgi:hypothetical protein